MTGWVLNVVPGALLYYQLAIVLLLYQRAMVYGLLFRDVHNVSLNFIGKQNKTSGLKAACSNATVPQCITLVNTSFEMPPA